MIQSPKKITCWNGKEVTAAWKERIENEGKKEWRRVQNKRSTTEAEVQLLISRYLPRPPSHAERLRSTLLVGSTVVGSDAGLNGRAMDVLQGIPARWMLSGPRGAQEACIWITSPVFPKLPSYPLHQALASPSGDSHAARPYCCLRWPGMWAPRGDLQGLGWRKFNARQMWGRSNPLFVE